MDEEIMNFQWFEYVMWDNIKDLRVRRMFNHPQGSSLHHNKLNMPFYVPSFTTTLPRWHRSQPGKRSCSAAGYFSDDLQPMRLRTNVQTFWMHDWNSSGLRTGQRFGWYALNVISLQCRMPHAEQPCNKSSHEYEKSPHQHELVKKDEPWQLPETHHQSQSQSRSSKRSRVSTLQTRNHQFLRRPSCQACTCQKLLSTSPRLFAKCHDSANLDHLECVRSIGMTLALWQEQQLVCASSCTHCSCIGPTPC